MPWSIPLIRIAGTEVRIHATFVLVLLWIGLSYYVIGGAAAAFSAVGFLLALFFCVLLHEFGHVWAARCFGISTPDITLLPIGGMARMQEMPERPGQEFVVAIAGPLVNVLIAAVLWPFAAEMLRPENAQLLADPQEAILAKLLLVNVILVVFNCIPAFPMDGGRIFRALLGTFLPYSKATLIAARCGQGMAFVFGFLGLMFNPLLLFIALFVYLGAQQEASIAQIRDVGRGVPVSEAMVTELHHLSRTTTLDEAVEVLLRTSQHEFPVTDEEGVLYGVVTRNDIIGALRKNDPSVYVSEFMQKDLPTVDSNDRFEDAFREMQRRSLPVVPVQDRQGRFAGLLTPENVGELVLVRSIRPEGDRPSWVKRHGQAEFDKTGKT
ncbi:MAG: site-2 protease family protein [Opitutales bacterium]